MSISIDIKFTGKDFSPKKFGELSGLPIESIDEAGEKATYGPHKGKSLTYGFGILSVKKSKNPGKIFTEYLDRLISTLKDAESVNLDKITIEIEASGSQESYFSFESDTIHKLSLLKANVIYSTYEEENVEEDREKLLNNMRKISVVRTKDNDIDKASFAGRLLQGKTSVFVSHSKDHKVKSFASYVKELDPNIPITTKLNNLIEYYNTIHDKPNERSSFILDYINKMPKSTALALMTGFLYADSGATGSVSFSSQTKDSATNNKEEEEKVIFSEFLKVK